MIVTSTDYDVDSHILEEIASAFTLVAGPLVAQRLDSATPADAATVQLVLNPQDGKPFFFFGHGRRNPAELSAQDQQPAIHAANQHLLNDRLIFAFACHSAPTLAPAANHHGATVVGYNGKLRIPRQNRYRKLFRRSLLAGAELLVADGTKSAADAHQEMKTHYKQVERQLLSGSVNDKVVLFHAFHPNDVRLSLAGNPLRTL